MPCGDPRGPRAGEAGTEKHAVAGLEEKPDRRPVLKEEVGTDHGHVGNHRAAEHAGELGLLQHELVLEPLVLLIVQAAHGDQVLQVAAPGVERVLEPEEVLETPEADVEELGRHVPGDRLDLRFLCRLAVGARSEIGDLQRARVRRRRQGLVRGHRGLRRAEDAVLLDGDADALAARQRAQLPLELSIARFFLLVAGERQIQPPGERADEVRFELRGKVGLLREEPPRRRIIAPPGLQQGAMGGRVAHRLDDDGDRPCRLNGQFQRAVAAKEEIEGRARRTVKDAPQDPADPLPDRSAGRQGAVFPQKILEDLRHARRPQGRIEHAARFLLHANPLQAQRFGQQFVRQVQGKGTDAERLAHDGLGVDYSLAKGGRRVCRQDRRQAGGDCGGPSGDCTHVSLLIHG